MSTEFGAHATYYAHAYVDHGTGEVYSIVTCEVAYTMASTLFAVEAATTVEACRKVWETIATNETYAWARKLAPPGWAHLMPREEKDQKREVAVGDSVHVTLVPGSTYAVPRCGQVVSVETSTLGEVLTVRLDSGGEVRVHRKEVAHFRATEAAGDIRPGQPPDRERKYYYLYGCPAKRRRDDP